MQLEKLQAVHDTLLPALFDTGCKIASGKNFTECADRGDDVHDQVTVATVENSYHYDECVSVTTMYAYADGNPVRWFDPLGKDIVVTSPYGIHQTVGVLNPKWSYGQSFKAHSYVYPLGGKGEIYNNTSDLNPKNVYERFKTTPAEDRYAQWYLQYQLYYQQSHPSPRYWLVGRNCRDYSQTQYSNLVKRIKEMRKQKMSLPIANQPPW